MAYVFRSYRCSECSKVFEVMRERSEGPPRFCLECGAEFADDAEPVPTKIAVGGSPIARATDQTYRDLEESSTARAEALGAPELKITNLKDGLREGDVAAMPARNDAVTRFAAEAQQRFGSNYLGWGGGMAGAGRIASPIAAGNGQSFAGPGHIALSAVQPEHRQKVAEIVSRPAAVHRG